MPSLTPTSETGQGILPTVSSRSTSPMPPKQSSYSASNNSRQPTAGPSRATCAMGQGAESSDSRAGGSRGVAQRPAFHHAATDVTRGAGLLLTVPVAGGERGQGETWTRPGSGASSGTEYQYDEEGYRDWQQWSKTPYTSELDNPYSSKSLTPIPDLKPHTYSTPNPEKYAHSPPPSYSPFPSHAHTRHDAHRSQAQLLPPADIHSGGFFNCAKRKLMGKEGGMGMALMLGWVVTTVGFCLATAFYRGELFGALDRLSKHLRSLGLEGKGIFLLLILLTTIPPLPLYSTLMVLAGYTFGVWEGFVVSYLASLMGAVLVFVVSRYWLRDCIAKSLQSSPTAQSLLAILPANPHLLLLIRIAPYPYNLLNVILASAPTLSLKTYTACTAISLLKLVLHTWIGAGIHDIASYGSHPHRAHGGWHGHAHGHGDGIGYLHGPFPGAEHEMHGEWPVPPEDDFDAVDRLDAMGAEGRDGDGWQEGWPQHDHGHGYGFGHVHGHGHALPHRYGHLYGHHARDRMRVKMYATWIGIALCVGLFFYLTHLAKKALKRAQMEEEARREGGVRLVGSDEEC